MSNYLKLQGSIFKTAKVIQDLKSYFQIWFMYKNFNLIEKHKDM